MDSQISKFKNMDDFLNYQCKRYGDNTCLIDGDNPNISYSYNDLNTIVDQTAVFLTRLGIKKGDRFAIFTSNCPEFIFLFLASMKLGTLIVPIASDAPTDNVSKIISSFKVQTLFAGDSMIEVAQQAKEKTNVLEQIIPLSSLLGRISSLTPDKNLYESVGLDDPGSLYSSSGTTGEPKGIPQSPMNVLSASFALAKAYGFDSSDIQAGILPCYHTALTGYGFLPALVSGSAFVLFSKFSQSKFWENLEQYKVSYVNVVPTILSMLINKSEDVSKYDLSNLKFIGSGSAPLSENLKQQFEEYFKVPIANQFGTSETGPIFFNAPSGEERKKGAIGKSLTHAEISIVDKDGKETAVGEIGEIAVRGNSVIKEYYQNPDETKNSFKDRWFYTGDLAHKDKDGFYFLAGRNKEMINRGGQNIYPNEVDNIILSLKNDVKEVAVVGVPDHLYGEEVVAYVTPLKEDKSIKDIINKHCAKELPPYKCPKAIFFIDKIPKTPSGKIFRRKLREQYDHDYGVEIITATLGHKEQLKEFYERIYRPGYILSDERFMMWWLHDNPYFKGNRLSAKIAIKDGKIIGHCAFIPQPIWSNGKVYQGAWTGNLIVDEDYRGMGIGGRIHRATMNEFDTTLDIGANELGEQVLHKNGWTNFGKLNRAVGVIDAQAMKDFTKDKSLPEKYIIKTDIRISDNIEVIEQKRFEDDIDIFWKRYRDNIKNSTERTSQFLNWRYAEHPYFDYKIFTAVRGGKVEGILVVRLENVSECGRIIVRIVEFMAFEDSDDALINALIEFAQKENAVFIDFFCAGSKYLKAFEKFNFCTNPEKVRMFTRLFNPIDLERKTFSTISFNGANVKGKLDPKLFADKENWYVTSGDGDQDRPNKV